MANGYFVGTINRVGIEPLGDDDFYGQSYFVDPRGQYIGDVGDAHEEELLVRDMDLSIIEQVRQTWQFYRDPPPGHVRRPGRALTTWATIARSTSAAMDFGFTLKPDHTIARTIALTRQAEAAGFTYGWLFDSHVLWKEVYPLLTLMALNTERMRLGTCVTNPATREPSVTASVARDPRRDLRRPHGPGHRPGRQRPPGAGQAAHHDAHAGGGDRAHPRPRGGPRTRLRGHGAQAAVDGLLDGCRCGSPATVRWRCR